MKAAYYETYGAPEVVHLREIDRPEPRSGEVLVKVAATIVSSGDARMRAFDLPELMGRDAAHEAVGDFEAERFVGRMSGSLPVDPRLALCQIESMTYLRNQLLRDSDWASMDHSVELRTPLVDAWMLERLRPVLGQFARFPGKRLLAEAPSRPLPREVMLRRKSGFGIPVGRWLAQRRQDARETGSRGWACELVDAYAKAAA